MTRSAALRWLPPLAALAAALLWLVSPLDPLPDVVPLLGWLDDLAALLAGLAFGAGWVVATRPEPLRPDVIDARELPRLPGDS